MYQRSVHPINIGHRKYKVVAKLSATDLSSLLLDSTSCSSANNDRSHPVCEADSTIRNTMLPFPSILLSRECPALVCIFLHSSRTSYGTACCRRRVCSAPSTVAAAAVAVKITGRCATARHASREARSHVDEWTCLTRTHESCGNRFIYTSHLYSLLSAERYTEKFTCA